MLFMPGDPLNSGGKSQGWFLDVLGIREDGRVELFALPTGKFSTRSTAFCSMIFFGNYFRTVLVFVTMVFYRREVSQHDLQQLVDN